MLTILIVHNSKKFKTVWLKFSEVTTDLFPLLRAQLMTLQVIFSGGKLLKLSEIQSLVSRSQVGHQKIEALRITNHDWKSWLAQIKWKKPCWRRHRRVISIVTEIKYINTFTTIPLLDCYLWEGVDWKKCGKTVMITVLLFPMQSAVRHNLSHHIFFSARNTSSISSCTA